MKMKKIITSALAVAMVAGMSIGGTYAWLTSKPADVVNTFSVGKVGITLDEAPVNEKGVRVDGGRVLTNKYHLVPAHTYLKDPTVHVTKGSEDCFVFVKVANPLSDSKLEQKDTDDYDTIYEQITVVNQWKELSTTEGKVYYKEVSKESAKDADLDLQVFNSFTVNPEATNADLKAYGEKLENKIVIKAYAIQQDGFTGENRVLDAWNAVK